MKILTLLSALALAALPSPATQPEAGFRDFITARGSQLMEGNQPFRFISFNLPNLTYTEDDMRFEQMSGFRLPTAYEIDDALASIQQIGGRVARTYVLSVHKTNDPTELPRHILSPDKLNEPAMVVLDQVLATANRRGVRLIIPFIDQASWWGGIQEFAAWRGKAKGEFYTDPQVKDDYRRLVSLVLHRTNTITGVRYMDDKAVLAWELGNELQAPAAWVSEMAPYIKQLDPKHLVAESYFTDPDNAGVDIVQDHLYQGDPVKMLEQIQASVKQAAGRKVYMAGEFGFVTTEGMRAIMDTIIQNQAIAGGLIWSLRFHDQDGGYYWHHEPHGGDFFKAYHWPGGPAGQPYDEARFMRMVREKAWQIQGRPAPPLEAPAPPDLFSVTDGGVITWRGSAGRPVADYRRPAHRRRGAIPSARRGRVGGARAELLLSAAGPQRSGLLGPVKGLRPSDNALPHARGRVPEPVAHLSQRRGGRTAEQRRPQLQGRLPPPQRRPRWMDFLPCARANYWRPGIRLRGAGRTGAGFPGWHRARPGAGTQGGGQGFLRREGDV